MVLIALQTMNAFPFLTLCGAVHSIAQSRPINMKSTSQDLGPVTFHKASFLTLSNLLIISSSCRDQEHPDQSQQPKSSHSLCQVPLPSLQCHSIHHHSPIHKQFLPRIFTWKYTNVDSNAPIRATQ